MIVNSLAPTRARLDILGAVSTGRIYHEANAYWCQPDERRITRVILQMIYAMWVTCDPRWEGKTRATITTLGRDILSRANRCVGCGQTSRTGAVRFPTPPDVLPNGGRGDDIQGERWWMCAPCVARELE